jgi:lambda repressor-like predicted transcriptional regulator
MVPLDGYLRLRDWSTGDLALLTGIRRETLIRYRTAGVPMDKADHIATTLGVHPTYFWPEFSDEPHVVIR